MWVVRPAESGDLAGIQALVRAQRVRASTLPGDADQLGLRLEQSRRAFAGDAAERGRERFLFVLEETDSGEILGTAGIHARAGSGQPFYNYRLDELIHSSHSLGVSRRVSILYLSHELTDTTLLCSFVLRDDLRKGPAFELLSRARLVFVAQHRQLFADTLIAEIQGRLDGAGQSPFWDSLGRHFFAMDFATADEQSALRSKTFIAELMPSHPIYVTLLSEAAQAALGQPRQGVEDVCALLEREGLARGLHRDIFDGGPTYEGRTDALASIRACQACVLEAGRTGNGRECLVANTGRADFRCVLAPLAEPEPARARLAPAYRKQLGVKPGDRVRWVVL